MKTNLYIALVSLLCFATACKKNTAPGLLPGKLKYLTQISRINGKDTTITNYTYDAQKKLTQITVITGARTSSTTITYSGDKISYTETISKNGTAVTGKVINDFAYADNLVATKKTRRYDATGKLLSDASNGYAYNDRNQLVEAHQDGNVAFYEYGADGNVVKTKFPGVEINYTYDGKMNKTANLNLAIKKAAIPLVFEDFGYIGNLVSITRTGVPATTYVYEYGIDNYPVSAKNGNEVATYKYIIE